jgi:hypothetical protein
MTEAAPSSLTALETVDEYFIETRNRVLELAAFLDRVDRAGGASDFRMRALTDAIAALSGEPASRVSRIQHIFSDPTFELRPALDRKGAVGAFDDGR